MGDLLSQLDGYKTRMIRRMLVWTTVTLVAISTGLIMLIALLSRALSNTWPTIDLFTLACTGAVLVGAGCSYLAAVTILNRSFKEARAMLMIKVGMAVGSRAVGLLMSTTTNFSNLARDLLKRE